MPRDTQKITLSEFLEFAQRVQTRRWVTITEIPFEYSVTPKGMSFSSSTIKNRTVRYGAIEQFCVKYSESNSPVTTHYKGTHNASYLLPIAHLLIEERAIWAEVPLAEEISDVSNLREGAVRFISINEYERNPKARKLCIEAHGTRCLVCGFSFAETYGEIAEGFIHTHHLSPLALSEGEREIDPVTDLRPVCPNCHAVIHLKGGCMSIQSLREILNSTPEKVQTAGKD